MRQLATALRGLISDTVRFIDVEGFALIVGTAILCVGAAQFDARYPYLIVGGLLVVGAIALARPRRAA